MTEFLMCMILCNTAQAGIKGSRSERDIVCQSEDERALIMAASQFGFQFIRSQFNQIFTKIFNELEKFSVKAIFPYTSQRKMMSVVVKTWQGEYVLYCKGSDEKIIPLIVETEKKKRDKLSNKVIQYANESLRTIVLA